MGLRSLITQSLKRLSKKLSAFIHKDNAKEKEVRADERISRYILSKRQYSVAKNVVKHNAFMPPRNLLLSVYRTSDLDERAIWDIGDKFVAAPQGKEIKARADIKALDAFTLRLNLIPEISVHKLHSDIVDWPKEKDEQKMLAVELANKATLLIKK